MFDRFRVTSGLGFETEEGGQAGVGLFKRIAGFFGGGGKRADDDDPTGKPNLKKRRRTTE